MKAVIISGGKAPSYDVLKSEIKDAALIICADKGAEVCRRYNITPSFILGDFDSLDKDVLNYYKNENKEIITYPKEKDYTDTEIAVETAIEKGADVICLLGCTGTRIDHVLGNLGLLKRCLLKGIYAYIIDDNNKITVLKEGLVIKRNEYKYFSLQSYSEEVHNLTIKGCKYELNNYNLKIGDPLTVSNEFILDEVSITFKDGFVLLIFSKD